MWRHALSLMLVFVFLVWAFPAFSGDATTTAPADESSVEHGKELFQLKCIKCHGREADGKGYLSNRHYPRPRDFTRGVYKIKSTLSGEVPTDHDLFRTISRGMPESGMPAWEKHLPNDKDRWDLVAYLKTLSDRFKSEPYTQVVDFNGKPAESFNLLREGESLYRDPKGAKCFTCHGLHGRGNGPNAEGLLDDWKDPVWPTDLTQGYRLRGGESVEDLYRSISTGFDGTPMPGYLGTLDPNEKMDERKRWALAYYLKSLQIPRKPSVVFKASRLTGDVPRDPADSRWEGMEWVDIPMSWQRIVKDPRVMTPPSDNLSVKVCANDQEVAFLVSWNDRTQNTKRDGGKNPDAVGVQFADEDVASLKLFPRRYFDLGDRPLELWWWRADRKEAGVYETRGLRSAGAGVEPGELPTFDSETWKVVFHPEEAKSAVTSRALYDDGTWKVVFVRSLAGLGPGEVRFRPGEYVAVAFVAWNGNAVGQEGNGERSNSFWHYLTLSP